MFLWRDCLVIHFHFLNPLDKSKKRIKKRKHASISKEVLVYIPPPLGQTGGGVLTEKRVGAGEGKSGGRILQSRVKNRVWSGGGGGRRTCGLGGSLVSNEQHHREERGRQA